MRTLYLQEELDRHTLRSTLVSYAERLEGFAANVAQLQQDGGVAQGAIRALSHCALASPNSYEAGTSAHTDGRRSWIVQRE